MYSNEWSGRSQLRHSNWKLTLWSSWFVQTYFSALTRSAQRPSLYCQNRRRQIVTYKDNPRTERMDIFLTAIDQYHRYSYESERANWGVYYNFELNKTLWFSWLIQKYFSVVSFQSAVGERIVSAPIVKNRRHDDRDFITSFIYCSL